MQALMIEQEGWSRMATGDAEEGQQSRRERGRIDLKSRVKGVREEGDRWVVEFESEPDPERYEWVEMDGETYLFDKLDRIRYAKTVLEDLAKGMEGLPMYYKPPKINDIHVYLRERLPEIRDQLEGRSLNRELADKSAETLQAIGNVSTGFAILCVDLVGSTRLSRELRPERYATVIQTMLTEMSHVVAQFHGHVLKYTGDGLIAYFPPPAFTLQNDLAMDCALGLHHLVYQAINPILESMDLRRLNIRIGIESGDAHVIAIGSPETKRQQDVIGDVVSLAAKIQGIAQPGGISIGQHAARNLHVGQRKHFQQMTLPDGWAYKDATGRPYQVLRYVFSTGTAS